MKFTPGAILLIVAVVIFVAVAVGVNVGNIQLLPLGLAAFAAAFVIGGTR